MSISADKRSRSRSKFSFCFVNEIPGLLKNEKWMEFTSTRVKRQSIIESKSNETHSSWLLVVVFLAFRSSRINSSRIRFNCDWADSSRCNAASRSLHACSVFQTKKFSNSRKVQNKIHFQAKQRTKIRLIFNSPISLRCRLFISESFRCASKQSSYRFCISSNSFCNFFAFSISFSKFVRSCWHTLSNVWKSSTAEIFCSACKVFIVWKRSHFNLPWSVTIIDSYFM